MAEDLAAGQLRAGVCVTAGHMDLHARGRISGFPCSFTKSNIPLSANSGHQASANRMSVTAPLTECAMGLVGPRRVPPRGAVCADPLSLGVVGGPFADRTSACLLLRTDKAIETSPIPDCSGLGLSTFGGHGRL